MSKDEIDMYDKVCKGKFDAVDKRFNAVDKRFDATDTSIKEVKTLQQATHKAICESNGKPSILSRLDMIEKDSEGGGLTKKLGIESRDLPRIICALGIVALVLERFGALQPILEMFASK